MKKSDIYQYAQRAVVEYPGLTAKLKLEVIRELMKAEELYAYTEKMEEPEKVGA